MPKDVSTHAHGPLHLDERTGPFNPVKYVFSVSNHFAETNTWEL